MKSFIIHLLLIAAALIFMLPFIWLICAAFAPASAIAGGAILPWGHPTLDHFRNLLRHGPFGLWMFNSLFIASANTTVSVALGSLGGFALAKYRFAGKRLLIFVMLGTMLLPSQVLLPGSYELMYRFGWIDSYLAILLPGSVSAFGMLLFRQSMLGVPDELLQCGRLDGCSELRLWWDIALPTVRPMIGAYTLLSFLSTWNSFLWPQIILQSENKYTLPIALNSLTGLPEFQHDYSLLMAATLLSILPVIVLFFALQKDFISGLASGAVKG